MAKSRKSKEPRTPRYRPRPDPVPPWEQIGAPLRVVGNSIELLTEENRTLTLEERLQALARRGWVIQRRSFDEIPSRVLRTIQPFGKLPPEGEAREEAFEYRKSLQDSALRVCKKKSISLLRVCSIGERAQRQAYAAAWQAVELEIARERTRDLAFFQKWLAEAPRAARFVRFSGSMLGQRTVREMKSAIEALIVAGTAENEMSEDERREISPDLHYRHPKAGRRARFWVRDAKKALRKLGVPAAACDELLIGWGLIHLSADPTTNSQ